MNQRVTAVVEQGRLRPTVPLDLPEGTEVQIIIVPSAPAEPPKPRRRPHEILAELAALPDEPGPEFSGRDHDRILYGEGGAR